MFLKAHIFFIWIVCFAIGVSSELLNLASPSNGATCSASSELNSGSGCDKAIDGRQIPVESDFITNREGVGSWITINFQNVSEIQELRFLQRCSQFDKTAQVKLEFGDQSSQTVTLSCTGGDSNTDCDTTVWERVSMPAQVIASYVNISTTSVCSGGAFNGFREIVVLGNVKTDVTRNLALAKNGGTCDASSEYYDEDHLCTDALDGIALPDYTTSWSTLEGDTMSSWLKIDLPSVSKVSKIRIKNRCLLTDQMKRVSLEFDDGTSQEMHLNCYDGLGHSECPGQIWNEIVVNDVITSSVMILPLEACDPSPDHNAFQEVEIFGISEENFICPFGFDQPPELTSCYKFVTAEEERLNLTSARAACSKLHPSAHLVEITSDSEQDYIARSAELLNMNGDTCTRYHTNGFRNSEVSDEWFWASTGQRIVRHQWGPGDTGAAPKVYILLDAYESEESRVHWQWVATSGASSNCYICKI